MTTPRTANAYIRALIRQYIGDPAGTGQHFTEDKIQDAADHNRKHRNYARATQNEFTLLPGGIVRYLTYRLDGPYWDIDSILVNQRYIDVTSAATIDWQNGWATFTVQPLYPILARGWQYQPKLAAADLLDIWAASLSNEVNSTTDGDNIQAGDLPDKYRAAARSLRASATGVYTLLPWRSDERY